MSAVIRLRPVIADDLAFTCRWRNDPEIRRLTLARPQPTDPYFERAWFESIPTGDRPADLYRIVEAGDHEPVGLAMLRDIDWEVGCATFGIWIAGDRQGRGLGTLATQEMAKLAWSMGLRTVRLRVLAEHKVALRTYERVGFRPVGFVIEPSRAGGPPVELRIMELTAPST